MYSWVRIGDKVSQSRKVFEDNCFRCSSYLLGSFIYLIEIYNLYTIPLNSVLSGAYGFEKAREKTSLLTMQARL